MIEDGIEFEETEHECVNCGNAGCDCGEDEVSCSFCEVCQYGEDEIDYVFGIDGDDDED